MSTSVSLQHHISDIRSVLAENVPWSPLDFIRSISISGDKRVYVDRLTRHLDEQDDIRFVYRYPDGERLAVFAERLPWDSEFFGYGVARLDGVFPLSQPFHRPYADYTDALTRLVEEAKGRETRYLFARIDPRDLATLRALGQLGFCLIETRSYYYIDIRKYHFPRRFPVRIARSEDTQRLGRVATEMANLYDRFHADPFIAKEDADRLMYRWVEASICEQFADFTLVPDLPQPAAFVTVRYNRDLWHRWGLKLAQGVLSAVSPRHRGWYLKLVSEGIHYLHDNGAERLYVATQITNYPVIRVWERLGFRFGRCEHILRIIL